MQIERKPSRWPYVVLLVGLLLACFLAPAFWHAEDAPQPTVAERSSAPSDSRAFHYDVGSDATTDRTSFVARNVPTLIPGRLAIDWIAANGLIPNRESWSANGSRAGLVIASLPSNEAMVSSLCGGQPVKPTSELWASERQQYGIAGSGKFTLSPATGAYDPKPIIDTDAVAAIPGPGVVAVLRLLSGKFVEYSPAVVGGWVGETTCDCCLKIFAAPRAIAPDIGPLASAFPAAEAAAPVELALPVDAAPSEPTTSSPWSAPDALFVQLARLARDPYSAYWAEQTISQLQALLEVKRFQGDETNAVLAALNHSAQVAAQLAEQAGNDRMRVALLRAHWGLARRLDCWKVMNDIRVAAVIDARVATRGSLNSLLQNVAQREDLESLDSQLEAYERARDPALAYRVALAGQKLAASPDSLDRSLADAVEQHYRNANIRVAITGQILNRWLPNHENESSPVWDRIAGTPVRGHSDTSTVNRVLLQPATGRWHMSLESSGVVDSNTMANGGSARLHSYGTTDFSVRKTVIVERDGVHMQPAVSSANNYNHLAGVTTDFDWVPIFGAYARSRALDQYRAKRPRAKAEIEWKVTSRASERLDEEAADAAERLEREIRGRLTEPLAAAGIELTPIELTSTTDRLVARFRVAGDAQLGGHTPRPQALSDSLASVQLHESALTNAAVSLGLDGEQFSAPQLQARLQERFPDLRSDEPVETRRDTLFQFASHGAVQFRIDGGRFEIAVQVAEFEQDARRIRNFIVHAYYVPVVDDLTAKLVRDGALGIEGRINATERARLYSVFNEVLGTERRLPILRLSDSTGQRLAGLMITQLVLEDGWLGLSIGPETGGRVAERSRSLR